MKIPEIHLLLYNTVVAGFIDMYDSDGGIIRSPMGNNGKKIIIGYQIKPNFEHNYQRNKFMKNRDRYAVLCTNLSYLNLATKSGHKVTIHESEMSVAFGDDKMVAIKVLKSLLKPHFIVEMDDKSTVSDFDTSDNYYSSNRSFYVL